MPRTLATGPCHLDVCGRPEVAATLFSGGNACRYPFILPRSKMPPGRLWIRMDISFHYPPELMQLLIDTITRLCRSYEDTLLFLPPHQNLWVSSGSAGDI